MRACCCSARAVRERTSWRASSTIPAGARQLGWSRCIARPSRRRFSRASCSGTRRAHSPVRTSGHLAAADAGTLFLDEIGEVTPATQVKLLRFLQEREFVPVGSTQARKVAVRVVAATNRDLEAAVKAGTFREDF